MAAKPHPSDAVPARLEARVIGTVPSKVDAPVAEAVLSMHTLIATLMTPASVIVTPVDA